MVNSFISLGDHEKSHGEISLGDHENSHGETKRSSRGGGGGVKFVHGEISLGDHENSHGEILLVHHVVFLVQIVAA